MVLDRSERLVAETKLDKRLRDTVKRLFAATRDTSIPLDHRLDLEILLAVFAGRKGNP